MRTSVGCLREDPSAPPRRALLTFVVGAGALTLLGCDAASGGWTAARARVLTDDETRLGIAIAATRRLRDATLTLGRRLPAGTPRRDVLPLVAAHHLLQLAALGDRTGVPVTATPPPVLGPRPTSAAALRARRPDDLGVAQEAAARLLAEQAVAASPGPATLLARIAAGQYVHARLLAPGTVRAASGPTLGFATAVPADPGAPGPSATTSPAPAGDVLAQATATLQGQLAAEHAAVYAYGVLTARSSGAGRDLAEALWDEHEVLRGHLQADLLALGATPGAAEAAYALPPRRPRDLAALVEAGTARWAAAALAVDHPQLRAASARRLAEAAWRQARWGAPQALPGA